MTNRDTESLFAYHEATKHTYDSVYRSAHTLDWDNMPDPFRHYGGVPVLDLPADPQSPEVPALAVLSGRLGEADTRDAAHWLSQLFYYSAAISASKRAPSGYRYSLRVNPSSGNLHPTEFHFAANGLLGWPDGLYHYRPSSHEAEQRGLGNHLPLLAPEFADVPLLIILTSIAWREAWKYRNRAYRYCLLDIGHAWQALEMAARSIGAETYAAGYFADEDISRALHLSDEWPMLMVALRGRGIPAGAAASSAVEWMGGVPNVLSPEQIAYPLIDGMHQSTKLDRAAVRASSHETQPWLHVSRPLWQSMGTGLTRKWGEGVPEISSPPFGITARRRRSALDFLGGARTMSRQQLETMLRAATEHLAADFAGNYLDLYLYVHRVQELPPGVYRHSRHDGALELVKSGDQRVIAAALSLGQDLAGNACVTFSMVADLDRAAKLHGNRSYRFVHFEAGAIGQRLYLAAEALGLQCTGIGAFFDDEVHRYLGIETPGRQTVYHFACGFAVPDERLLG